MTNEDIITTLDPLFERAEKENLYFYYSAHELWFSPKNLRNEHKQGRFIWGPSNWELRDPDKYTEELENKVKLALIELKKWELKLLSS